jgi:hypothetical protein
MLHTFRAYDVADEFDFTNVRQTDPTAFTMNVKRIDAFLFEELEVACRNQLSP